jgi:hypothetical protein
VSEIYDLTEKVFRLRPREGIFSSQALALLAYGLTMAPTLQQEEYASRFRKRIYSSILERNDHLARQGGMSAFEVHSADKLELRWRPISSDEPKGREWLRRRAVIAEWLDGLSDNQYETAAGLLMDSLGASRRVVTRAGDDFGIDFLAIIPAYCKNPLFMSGARGIRIVGQSKKYSTAVARDKLQSFISVMNSIRENKSELINVIPPWFRGSSSPLLSCFISHSGFQSGSAQISAQHGYVTLDTLQMAEILAKSKSLVFGLNEDQIRDSLWRRIGP